eukprot:SAG31_NODE_3745_length_3929_cov_2.044125_3_plen_260_part_00
MEYFRQKLYVGYTCFNCERVFGGWQATLNHMVDKCHCGLPYDGTHDEINQYYDWEAWAEAEGVAVSEEEPAPEGDETGGWEDQDDDDEEDHEGEGEWEEMDEDEVALLETSGDGHAVAVAQRAGGRRPKQATAKAARAVMHDEAVNDMVQELVLPGGRRAGHRSLQRYFKQSVRPERREQADLITRLITSYRGMGYQMALSRTKKQGRPVLSRAEKRFQRQTWVAKQHMEMKLSIKQNRINVGPRGSGWNPRYGAEAFL